eukprot:UN24742
MNLFVVRFCMKKLLKKSAVLRFEITNLCHLLAVFRSQ